MESINNKMQNLVEISSMVAKSTNFFAIKDKIIEKMLEVVHPTKACVNLFYNNNYKYAYLVCSQTLKEVPNLFPGDHIRGVKIDFDVYPEYIHESIKNKEVVYIKNVFEDDRAKKERPIAKEEGYVGRVVFPLIANNNVVGFMTCFLTFYDNMSEGDIDFISSVASLLSLSIDMTVKNRDVKQVVDKLRHSISVINEATKKLYQTKNKYEYLRELSEQSREITNSKEAVMIILEEDNTKKVFTTYSEKSNNSLYVDSILDKIKDREEVGDFENNVNRKFITDIDVSSYIYYKLMDKDELIGGIVCINSEGYSHDDLNILGILSRHIFMVIQTLKYNAFEVKHRLLANELNLLNKQQKLIMDKSNLEIEDKKELYYYHKPARFVGGDFYNAIKIKDGKIVYIVADVMGHGVVSNYVVAMIKGAFKILANQYNTPGEILTNLNNLLYEDFDKMGVFTTCLVGVIDIEKGTMSVSNAGHYSPIIIKKDATIVENLNCIKGIPIGILQDSEYASNICDISDSSMVCMYTDGVLEIKNNLKEEYGIVRLKKFLQNNFNLDRDIIIKNLKNELKEFAGDENFEDDILVVMLKDK